MPQTTHHPVLLEETLRLLGCRPGGRWVDGTAGGGGHAEAILRATSPDGRLLLCDRDASTLERVRERLRPWADRTVLRHADFRTLPALLDETGWETADGILLDLGLSSLQLEDAERGFSFRADGPLDMRMDRSHGRTAADLIRTLTEPELASMLRTLGEEPAARAIARAIVARRAEGPIATTGRLAEIITGAVGGARRARRPRAPGSPPLHPATRSFQALRLAVNDELSGLGPALESAAGRLAPGGRLAVIAFHSLEDRIVKRTLRDLAHRCACPRDLPVCGCGRPDLVRPVTPRAVRASETERRDNPRARSARLRVAERLPRQGAGKGGA